MKKIVVILLCFVMLLTLMACGDKSSENSEVDNNQKATSTPTPEPATPTPIEPNTTYDLNDGVERTKEDIAKMFDYWTEGFDDTIVANVKADGYMFFIDCDDDGKVGEADIVALTLVDADGFTLSSITMDLSKVEESKHPKRDDVIHVEGVWMRNPNTMDQSDFRLYVESISEGSVPAVDLSKLN